MKWVHRACQVLPRSEHLWTVGYDSLRSEGVSIDQRWSRDGQGVPRLNDLSGVARTTLMSFKYTTATEEIHYKGLPVLTLKTQWSVKTQDWSHLRQHIHLWHDTVGGRLVLVFRASSTCSMRPPVQLDLSVNMCQDFEARPCRRKQKYRKNRLNFQQQVFWCSNRYGLVLWDSMIATSVLDCFGFSKLQ